MINYLPGGRTFTKKSSTIDTVFKEISKEEFYRLNELSVGEVSDMVFETLDRNIIYGYGFYGATVVADDDGYYIKIRQGNTCE